jgi:SpoVK/Ycf46/Vps4 family AAA+-type ATPase
MEWWVVDEKLNYPKDIVHLARFGLAGNRRDIETYVRRVIKRSRNDNPQLADELSGLLSSALTPAAPLRDAGGTFVPVDRDSRLQLLRHENPVILDRDPILAPRIASALDLVITEREQMMRLASNDLKATRTLLFTGKPGVGKTLSARWMAARLGKPLLTLDLSTVISSYLGRTGANLRDVLDYAKSVEAVLLLDEFDAIAKHRGDETELGELKRLVTVVLQEIDLWPSDKLLIAATNHGELLDRAIWRRFDMVLEFPLPSQSDLKRTITVCFGEQAKSLGVWRERLLKLCQGQSFSDIERIANHARRRSILKGSSLEDSIIETLATEGDWFPLKQRKLLGEMLSQQGISDRKINQTLGLARDTLRSMRRKKGSR